MTIDADAHIEESEAMFERLDQEFRPRRPLPVKLDRDTVYGRDNAVGLIDGETYPNSRKPRDPGEFRFFHGSGTVGEGAMP